MLLTKSRFKTGLECPNKLFYASQPEYANQKKEDPFLEALAKGGFQVEALARLHYPGGIMISERSYTISEQLTRKSLKQDKIVIYEGAFLFQNLFVRSDIIVKEKNTLKLIEVKAKTFDSKDSENFVGKRGGVKSEWISYLFDIVFQQHVIQLCYPEFKVVAYLLMPDKNKTAKTDGLNQLIRIHKDVKSDIRNHIDVHIESLESIGGSVLTEVNVCNLVQNILNGITPFNNKNFQSWVDDLNVIVQTNNYPAYKPACSTCKHCEFRTTEIDINNSLRSGFENCFKKLYQWNDDDFKKPNILSIWNFRKCDALFSEGRFFMNQLTKDDFNIDYEMSGNLEKMDNKFRQWIQVLKATQKDNTPFVLTEELREEMDSWKYPLHFIDFETSAIALPFHKDRKPYEQVAFQYSHHLVHEDGTIEHASEYINSTPGQFPNFDFIRHLRDDLSHDDGSVFRYAAHENSVLNQIYEQLVDSDEPDKEQLISFIKSITKSKKDATDAWAGERCMIDLKQVIQDYYYNPLSGGSNSIKAILPAILNTSDYLQQKYTHPIASIGLSSKNFENNHVWIHKDGNTIINPYKQLPAVFDKVDFDDEEFISDLDDINNGGTAMLAYAQIQFSDMTETERELIRKSLLKYCELDTLAMVMIYEHFNELIK